MTLLRVFCCRLLAALLCVSSLAALTPEIIQSVGAVPPHVAGRFRDPRGFQQSASGQYFVFDRRGHTVYGLDEARTSSWRIVEIGGEPGRILEPTAFSVAPDGTFAIADAPGNRERIQIFSPAGFRIGGFTLPGRARPRVTFQDVVMNGIGSVHYTGTSILMSAPENGALITEYGLSGSQSRAFGSLRATGHETDRDVHLALNSGIPLADPSGGFVFVFQAGLPAIRKFDAAGGLVFERHIQGREIDDVVAKLPAKWPRRDDELPLVAPTVRAAAVDRRGNIWVSFIIPYTYVFDRDGDKTRTVQFRGAGLLAPSGLFFGPNDRLLVSPGLYEFDVDVER